MRQVEVSGLSSQRRQPGLGSTEPLGLKVYNRCTEGVTWPKEKREQLVIHPNQRDRGGLP